MSDEVDDPGLHEISQEVGQFVKDLSEKVHPLRVALAGVIMPVSYTHLTLPTICSV